MTDSTELISTLLKSAILNENVNEAHTALRLVHRKMVSAGFDPHNIAVYDMSRVGGASVSAAAIIAVKNPQIAQLEAENLLLTEELNRLKQAPVAVIPKAPTKAPKTAKPTAPPTPEPVTGKTFDWTPELYLRAYTLLFNGGGLPSIEKAFPALTKGQIARKFCNDPPDETLIEGGVQVYSDGREMTYWEFCKIGHQLYGDEWKGKMTKRFGLTRNAIKWNPPNSYLSAKQRQTLRSEFHK